ncbi:MAG: leucine-rich repeat domain-containing protein [Prevotella sp.]|nr:leucine-rich repeat domain-containing protein [Prevotella sp.]
MKKSLLTIALMLTAIAAGAKVYQPGDDLNYEYNDEEQTATVIPMRDTYKQDEYHIAYYNTYRGDIVIPETAPNGYTVVAIGDNAFQRTRDSRFESDHFPTITSISIPKTVKKIGTSAFNCCDSLKAFTILSTIEEIGNTVFDNSGITSLTIEDTDQTLIIGGGSNTSVTVFGSGFKPSCTVYAGRNIVTKDDKGPFQFANNITEITYGPKVTTFSKHECWRNSIVQKVKILSTQITVIPEGAFGECSALESINLPENLSTIQNSAFIWCKNLRDAVLPSTLKSIGNQTFDSCPLTPDYIIPASMEEIGNNAFNSSGITNLIIEDCDKPLTIGGGSNTSNNLFGSMFKEPATVYVGRDIIAPEGKGPFRFTDEVTSVTYGPLVTKLNEGEAWRTSSIEKVIIKSTKVTTIPKDAFNQNGSDKKSVAVVVLSPSISTIESGAFAACYALKEFYANPVTPPTCTTDPFNWVDKKVVTLYVPRGSVDAYKEAPVWKEFFNIEEMEETKCATPVVTLEDGKLQFDCATKGVTYHYDYSYPKGGTGVLTPSSDGSADVLAQVPVVRTVTVSVYATRAGLEDSDVAVFDLTINNGGDVNEDGAVDVADIATVITKMAGK